jgi:CheY-like chemotaxis protein
MAFIKRNILCVDDDPMAQSLVISMLGQAGYIVTAVKDGFEALELLHKYAFDLVILDIMMAEMSGLDLLKRIKAQPETKNLPVMMLSSRYDKQMVTRSVQLGAEDYVVKPPDRDKFLKKIELILGGRPRFAEVSLDEDSKRAQCNYIFDGRILSVGEGGMTFRSSIPLEINSFHNIRSPLFADIGIQAAQFRVAVCQKEKTDYTIYVTFVGLTTDEVSSVRQWVITQALKGRSVA